MIPLRETYGCQMNASDSEVVARLLSDHGYRPVTFRKMPGHTGNTLIDQGKCRKRVMARLDYFGLMKRQDLQLKVGILGCMATRLKEALLEHPAVDFVAGPDSYRHLPGMLGPSPTAPVQVKLSATETYADIKPYRELSRGVTSFVTIMRGCNNMCAYCIVPYVRGRERSRDPLSVEEEVRDLFAGGFREVTLLGQNVNSYHWKPGDSTAPVTFAQLLERVAGISSLLRVRYTTSHPKDCRMTCCGPWPVILTYASIFICRYKAEAIRC